MKRLVWLFVLFAVVGCGGDPPPTTGGMPPPAAKPPATPPKGIPPALPE